MKKLFTTAFLIFNFSLIYGQSKLNWSAEYKLTLEDFKSPQTEIDKNLNTYFMLSGSEIGFNVQMSNYEFMFTRNFNSKIQVAFDKNSAVISAPDSSLAKQLVRFGQYEFDLNELYARKFRKKVYDEKKTFSSMNIFQSRLNKIQEEKNAEIARVSKSSNLGEDKESLELEHQKVLSEIDSLSDFCLECKPQKKRKRNKRKNKRE